MTVAFRLLKRILFLSGLFAAWSADVNAQRNADIYDLYVYNGEARPIAGADIDLTGCGAGVQRTANDGTLHFSVPPGAGCYVTIRKFSMQEAVVNVSRSGPHQISLAMTADRSGAFTGVVVDQNTNEPLSGAVAYARSNISNHWTKAITNAAGRYTLRLNPRQEYVITYARNGYRDEQRLVRTERELRQEVVLTPISLQAGNTKLLTQNGGVFPKFVDIFPLQPGNANGYQVQIASGPTNFTEVSLKFGALTEYGHLYTIQEGDRYKLHLGVYNTRQDAQAVVNTIAADFPGAFASTEPNVAPSMLLQVSPTTHQTTTVVQSAPAPAQYSTASPVPNTVMLSPQHSQLSKGTDAPAQSAAPLRYEDTRYALQVGSFSADWPISLSEFARLDGLGHTYCKVENGAVKVRLGVWNTRKQADKARKEAIAQGFSDAAVVTERADDPALQNHMQAKTTMPTAKSVEQDPRPVVYSYTAPTEKKAAAKQVYYIRIAALANPGNFDPQPYASFGKIEKRRSHHGLTLILLGQYASLKEAQGVQERLRNRGFKEPYIVKEEGGDLKRI